MADSNKKNKKDVKDLRTQNQLYNDMISDLDEKVLGGNKDVKNSLNALRKTLTSLVDDEMNNMTSKTGEDVITFIMKTLSTKEHKTKQQLSDILESENEIMQQSFQQVYKNKNLLYSDLEMLTSHLYELDETISTLRDSIISADDMTRTISRSLFFKYMEKDEDSYTTNIDRFEKMEEEYELVSKLKNHIVPNTLRFGNYYVYVCPYDKLMSDYKRKIDDRSRSYLHTMEDSIDEIAKEYGYKSKYEYKDFIKNENIRGIEIITEDVSIPLVEDIDLSIFSDRTKFTKATDKYTKNKDGVKTFLPDGLKDKNEVFPEMSKCYIKYIDPRKILPVKIGDYVVGYYYIHGDILEQPATSRFTASNLMSINTINDNKDKSSFFSRLSDEIIKSFNSKYVKKNMAFKELILNALMYHDALNNKLKFQFIPTDYIVEFKINEDVNGDGKSFLTNSIFYAKLYLAIIMFKVLSVINYSNDQRVVYLKGSGIDSNTANAIQSAARNIKEQDMTWADLLNFHHGASSKGANKTWFIPTGQSGERGVEFDVISGQQVDLNTEFIEMIRNYMFNSTGAPAPYLNYINEVDYAKTLEMVNMKYISKVMSLQIDFDPKITELYRKIARYSNLPVDQKYIDNLHFSLNRPKSLGVTNLNDFISNADQLAQAEIKILYGENSDDEDINTKKDLYYKMSMMDKIPLDWQRCEEIMREVELQMTQLKMNKSEDESDDGGY